MLKYLHTLLYHLPEIEAADDIFSVPGAAQARVGGVPGVGAWSSWRSSSLDLLVSGSHRLLKIFFFQFILFIYCTWPDCTDHCNDPSMRCSPSSELVCNCISHSPKLPPILAAQEFQFKVFSSSAGCNLVVTRFRTNLAAGRSHGVPGCVLAAAREGGGR